MRRTRLQILLFALALILQVLAPIAGNLAVAGTIDLGGVSFKLCQSDKSDSSKAPLSHAQHQSCALCQVYCDGVSPVVSGALANHAQSAQWLPAHWRLLDRILPSTTLDYARQARAPPAFC
jgi:hypothetical protein